MNILIIYILYCKCTNTSAFQEDRDTWSNYTIWTNILTQTIHYMCTFYATTGCVKSFCNCQLPFIPSTFFFFLRQGVLDSFLDSILPLASCHLFLLRFILRQGVLDSFLDSKPKYMISSVMEDFSENEIHNI